MRPAKSSLSLFVAAAISFLGGVVGQASAQTSQQQSVTSLSGISGRVLDRIARVCNGGHCNFSNNTNSFDLSRIQQR